MKDKNINSNLTHDLLRLWNYFSRRRKSQLFLLMLLLVSTSFSEMLSVGAIYPFLSALGNPTLILQKSEYQFILSIFNITTSYQLVQFTAFGFILATISSNMLRLLTLNARVRLAAAIGADISTKIYSTSLRQSYLFHVCHNSSDLIQTVTTDTVKLWSNVLDPLLSMFSNLMLIPALIITILVIDPKIALITAVGLGCAYSIIYSIRKNMLQANSRVVANSGKYRIKIVQEGIGGIREVILGNFQQYFLREYSYSENRLKKSQATNLIVAQSPGYFIEAITLSSVALLSLGIGQGNDFSQAVPVLGSLALGAKRLLPALQQAFSSLAAMQGAKASIERVLDALSRPVDPYWNLSTVNPLGVKSEIAFEHVWFRYSPDSDWVLKDIQFTIKAKTTVAFVGTTGSGKSTTADLILGLLQPNQGEILVDNILLKEQRLQQWQRSIAHVPQHIFLSDGTLAQNIAFGLPEDKIDSELLRKSSKLAQIDGFIDSLPAKYETYVGERGVRLSGGQRQRIGIARAIYQQASVIVFDEATSALDNATEREVMTAIENLSGEVTIILIAHRLSTVKRCDSIVEFGKGKIIAQGSYKDLMQYSSGFRRMAAREQE